MAGQTKSDRNTIYNGSIDVVAAESVESGRLPCNEHLWTTPSVMTWNRPCLPRSFSLIHELVNSMNEGLHVFRRLVLRKTDAHCQDNVGTHRQ